MYRILDLKHGDYIRARTSFSRVNIGDIALFPTYESANLVLNNLPIILLYQKRIKEQYIIEEVPNE